MDASANRMPPHHRIVDGTLHLRHDGSILSADAAFCQLMGMSAQDLLERHWMSLFHPFDLPDIQQAVRTYKQEGEAHLTVRSVRSDGTVTPVYLHLCREGDAAGASDDYYCLVLNLGRRIDYTTEKMQFQRLFEISRDLLCVANTMGYFIQVNPAFSRLLGYSREELLQTSFLEFIHPDDVDSTLGELRRLRSGIDTLNFENRYRCKDGSWRWLAWSTPGSNGDGLLYAVAKDVTEHKDLESQLARLAKFDFLSGLPNRNYLDEELQRALARVRRNGQVLAGYRIHLEGLQRIIEQYGQAVGDDLLKDFALRLRHSLRANDFASRIDSDTFFVLAEQDDAPEAATLPGRILRTIATPFTLAGHNLRVDARIGIVAHDGNRAFDAEDFLRASLEDLLQREPPRKAQRVSEDPLQAS